MADKNNEEESEENADLLALNTDVNADLDIEAVENRKRYELKLKSQENPWDLSPRALEAKKAAMTMLSTKNGMHARIPIVCKEDSCPYADSCTLLPNGLAPLGEYCPVEIAQIDLRAASYSQDIDYDSASFTDRNLLSEIVTMDIMLERCKALMAKEGTPVIDMVVGVADNGDEIRQPSVSKAWEAYERISKKRDAAYQLMMMTRHDNKDKADDQGSSLSEIISKTITAEEYEAAIKNENDNES